MLDAQLGITTAQGNIGYCGRDDLEKCRPPAVLLLYFVGVKTVQPPLCLVLLLSVRRVVVVVAAAAAALVVVVESGGGAVFRFAMPYAHNGNTKMFTGWS